MKAAKIISIIGGVFYLLLGVQYLFVATRIGGLYGDLDIDYNPLPAFIFGSLIVVGLVLANFGYFYYLTKKKKNGLEVKNAVLFSVLIAAGPLILYQMISAFTLILPIYNITNAF